VRVFLIESESSTIHVIFVPEHSLPGAKVLERESSCYPKKLGS